jgi:hypothetical protein
MARQVYFEHPEGTIEDVRLDGFPIKPTFFFDTGMRPELDCSAKQNRATLRELTVGKTKRRASRRHLPVEDRCGYFMMDGVNGAPGRFRDKILQKLIVTTD